MFLCSCRPSSKVDAVFTNFSMLATNAPPAAAQCSILSVCGLQSGFQALMLEPPRRSSCWWSSWLQSERWAAQSNTGIVVAAAWFHWHQRKKHRLISTYLFAFCSRLMLVASCIVCDWQYTSKALLASAFAPCLFVFSRFLLAVICQPCKHQSVQHPVGAASRTSCVMCHLFREQTVVPLLLLWH